MCAIAMHGTESNSQRRRWVAAIEALCAVWLLAVLAPRPLAAQPGRSAGQPQAGQTIENSIGMKLAYIPAGTFVMGSPESEAEREPQEVPHEVTISRPFYLGVYEVTQRQFGQVMSSLSRGGAVFTESRGGGPEHPMENVPWASAVEFCTRLSNLPAEKQAGRRYRLPTEAEWEYACRAGTTTAFHFGEQLSSRQANFNGAYPYGGAQPGPYLRRTAKVGSYEPNAWGLYDMHGNVAEWCADYYDPDYYRRSPKADPPGPEKGVIATQFQNEYLRVVRGGSWIDEARACRSAYRHGFMPHEPNRLIGFRVLCEVE
jgi:formylglycine-generating enzyme required for sulfatase activity